MDLEISTVAQRTLAATSLAVISTFERLLEDLDQGAAVVTGKYDEALKALAG